MKLPEFKIKVTLKQGETFKITNSESAYEIIKQLISQDTFYWTEEMILLALNRSNEVYGWYRVSSGGTNATLVDPKVIFSLLLNAGASAFIIAHNHPSQSLIPSDADRSITKKLKDAGNLLDITLLDHLILAGHKYLSMSDEGIII